MLPRRKICNHNPGKDGHGARRPGSAAQSTGIKSKRRQARWQDPQPQMPLPGDKHTRQSGRRLLTERAETVQTRQRVSVQHRESPQQSH